MFFDEDTSFGKKLSLKIKSKFRWNIKRPLQHLFRGWATTDAWDAYYHMTKKILPVFKYYTTMKKMGIPSIIEREEQKNLIAMGYEFNTNSYSFSDKKINGKTAYQQCEEMWQTILNEILFALEYCANEDDEDCMILNPLFNPAQKEAIHFEPIEERDSKKFSTLTFPEDFGEKKMDYDLYRKKQERIQKGLELMGKYWLNFWD